MRRRGSVASLIVGLVLVVGTVGLTSCEPAPRRVLVIGDSLTVGAVQAGLGEGTGWDWTVSARSGRGTNEGIAIAQQRDIGAYDLVIVALGTNDYLDPVGTYRARIDQMMAALSEAPAVVWIDVDAATPRLAAAASGVNPAIAAAPNRHPKLTVGGWDAYVRTIADMASYRATDQIHYNAAGYRLRARWMEQLLPS